MGSGVLQKTIVIYHSLLLHQEMQLESLLLEEKVIHQLYAAMLQSSLGQSSSQIVKKSENVCCAQMSPHFNLFPGKTDLEFSVPKTKGTILTFISNRSKSKRLSWYGGAAEKHHGWVAYEWRYHWHGGIYWDCTEKYTAIKMMSFMETPCYYIKTMPVLCLYISVVS